MRTRFQIGPDEYVFARRRDLMTPIRNEAKAKVVAEAVLEARAVAISPGESHEHAVARIARALMNGDLRLVRIDAPVPLRGRPPDAAPMLTDLAPDGVVEPRTFVAIRVVDQRGAPVTHLTAELTLPDGDRIQRSLDAQARVRVDGIRGEDGEFDVRLVPPPLEPQSQ